MSDYASLAVRANWTELYQLLQDRGDNPPVSASREELVELLLGETDHTSPEGNIIDDYRLSIFHYVDEHWAKLRMQIRCPAKARQPTACNGCPDVQVITCLTTNPNLDRYVQLRRKSK